MRSSLQSRAVIALAFVVIAPAPAFAGAGESLATLRERFARSVLPADAGAIRSVHAIADKHARSVDENGRWSDLRYDGEADRAFWAGGAHLTRVLLMAKSARLANDAGSRDDQLIAKTLAALRAWTEPDVQNPNWWWNRIGVPELVGEIACLMREDLSPEELARDIKILRRSDMQGMTGANLTWCAINQVLLGCLDESFDTTRRAYDRLYDEVRFADASSKGEGIQPDFSFHQHGKQLYNGGYGLFYANDVGRFVYAAHGTPFQIPDAKREVFDGYMLDGMRWMTYGDALDYSTIGRVIARVGIVAVPTDWSLGPISPAGPAYSLGNIVRLLAELPGSRQAAYQAYAADLTEAPDAPPFEGNKHFPCSDYTAHRRAGFLTTVKMFSTRIRNGEIVNAEGRKSHHLSAGANFLYVRGDEYRDIFPAWDWQKVPGTTAEQVGNGSVEEMDSIEPKAVGALGRGEFVGGVSDGRYGLSAMDLRRGALSARKAWFFLDDAYVCLGNGITIGNDHPVSTTLNQSHLRGDARTSASGAALNRGTRQLDGARWVHHDNVGYVFAANAPVWLSTADQTGSWADFGAGPKQPVTLPVFKLWIDHSAGCKGAAYEYAVLPGASADQTARRAASPDWTVLSNRADCQAVFSEPAQLAAVTFWTAGSVDTPLGAVAVDRPCLVLVRATPQGWAITVSNPLNAPLTVRVSVASRAIDVALPGGPDAGASVTKILTRP